MSHKRKGHLTVTAEWAKHLRPLWKRWFWKGERKAEALISGDAGLSIEEILREIDSIPNTSTSYELWVSDPLTSGGSLMPLDAALAIILDKMLAINMFPDGYSEGDGGRLYRYVRDDASDV